VDVGGDLRVLTAAQHCIGADGWECDLLKALLTRAIAIAVAWVGARNPTYGEKPTISQVNFVLLKATLA
jgi:hypothetical protein